MSRHRDAMTPTLAAILSRPCCPCCLRSATRIDRTPESGDDAPDVLPGAAPVVYWWPERSNDAPAGWGYWAIRCSCDGDFEGFNEASIPTVRSLTPAAVLAWLEPTP
jgi:hypothetical protein